MFINQIRITRKVSLYPLLLGRWATGNKLMGLSAAYPIHFGRAIAMSFLRWRMGREVLFDDADDKEIAKGLSVTLPPSGEMAPEDLCD